MLYLSFFFTLFLYVIIIYAGFLQDKLFDGTVIHIDRVDGECRGKNVPCQGFVQGIKVVSTAVTIGNFTIVVKEGGFKKLMLSIAIVRCRAKENLDSCEKYFKQSNIDLCRAIEPNNFMSSQVSIGIPVVPPLKCPIKKGIYHAYNFTYDLAPFIFFNMNGWYWKTTSEIFSADQNNRLIFCMKTDSYVTSKSKDH